MVSGSSGSAFLVLLNVALTVTNAAKALVFALDGKWDNDAFRIQDLDGYYKKAEHYLLILEQKISDHGPRYPNHQELQTTWNKYREFLVEYKPILTIEANQPKGRWLRTRTQTLEKTMDRAQWLQSVQKAGDLKTGIILCTDKINRHNKSMSHDQLQDLIKLIEANISIRLRELEDGVVAEIRASTSTAGAQPTPTLDDRRSQSPYSCTQPDSKETFGPAPLPTPPIEGPLSRAQNRYRLRSSIDLGPFTEFQTYPARITINNAKPPIKQQKVELSYGNITWENSHVRFIGCSDPATSFTVDHKCCSLFHNLLARSPTYSITVDATFSVFPHTLHSRKASPCLYEVFFLQDFDLEISRVGIKPQLVKDDPRYMFEREEDCAHFQSWLRCKQSMKTFEVESVTSAIEKKQVAHEIGLKIWQEPLDGPSLSLFANKLTRDPRANMNVEFPVSFFKCDNGFGKVHKFKFKLEFETGRKDSLLKILFTWWRNRKEVEEERDKPKHGSPSTHGSVMSNASGSSIYSNPLINRTLEELAEWFQHLEIEFNKPEECTEFIKAFQSAQKSLRQNSLYSESPESHHFPTRWATDSETNFAPGNARELSEPPTLSPTEEPSMLPSPSIQAQTQPLGEAAYYSTTLENESPSPRGSLRPSDVIFRS